MKLVRILVSVLVVVFAAFLSFRALRGPAATSPKPAFPAPDDPATGTAIPEWLSHAAPATGPELATPRAPDFPEEKPKGTPVQPDAEVSLAVPYRAGTKSRYRVSDGEVEKEKDFAGWARFIWTASTQVEAVEPSGEARIRFQVDSFVFQTSRPGRNVEFDSTSPDNSVLDDKDLGVGPKLRCVMAILGMPVQFVVDGAGVIREVRGAEALHRKYLEPADVLGTQVRESMEPDAPSADSLREKWGEILFPAIGGGKLKASQSRDAEFMTTFWDLERWAAASPGKLRVTHDDPDVFRVEFKGKPEIRELGRPATNALSRSIAKAFVVSNADSYAASWRFDRANGRLVSSRIHAVYQRWVSIRVGPGNEESDFDPHYIDVERETVTELLDD